MPTPTDLVTDLPADFEVFGQAVDTSLADLKGGTTGQVLSKNSNTDMDFVWVTSDDANAIQNTIVDAKGDLISATGSDTPARLAVGANGETLVADSSASTGLRWQSAYNGNALINAAMDLWQRGTSFSGIASGAYTADRWRSVLTGTSISCTATQDTSVPNVNFKYSLKYQQLTSSATSLSQYTARQLIEQSNVLPFLGKTAVLSFWYKSNKTGSHGVRILATQNTGGADQATTFTVSVADTWEFKTVAVTAFSGVSAPSATDTSAGAAIDIGFRVDGGGFTTVAANDYFQVTGVQLQLGSVPTTFERAGGTIQGELSACSRYYQVVASGTQKFLASGSAYSASQLDLMLTYPEMRIAPNLVATSGTGYYVFVRNGGTDAFNSITLNGYTTPRGAALYNNTEISSTAGNAGWVYLDNASASVALNAEL